MTNTNTPRSYGAVDMKTDNVYEHAMEHDRIRGDTEPGRAAAERPPRTPGQPIWLQPKSD